MNFKTYRVNFDKIADRVEKYLEDNSILVDSFWENNLLKSNHYIIEIADKEAGYFSILDKQHLFLFYLKEEFRNESQEIFFKVRKYEEVNSAFVTTGDEFFLSHVLDNYSRLEKQAYFSEDSKRVIAEDKLDSSLEMRVAEKTERDMIIKYSGDFLDDLDERLQKRHIFIFSKSGEILGFGGVKAGKVLEKYWSIGMIVCEEHRGKGIGRNIIYKMKNYVYENGYEPISGCWYWNHNSKKTVGSAGFYSKTRLLKIYF